MQAGPEILALIIARGGSGRVPGKNVRMLGGLPLLAWTIKGAQASKAVTRVICSSDDETIIRTAEEYGAEAPFVRPSRFATAASPEAEAIRHAVMWLRDEEKYEPDLVVLLRPTTPFRRPETIDTAVETMLGNPKANAARSIRPCTEHPHKMWTVHKGVMSPFVTDGSRRADAHNQGYQTLPKVWVQNGSFDVLRPEIILHHDSHTGDVIMPVVMDETESIDINYEIDFKLAETVVRERREDIWLFQER